MRRSKERNAKEKRLAECVGRLIRERRLAEEKTLEQIARAVEMDPSMLSKLERGEVVVGASTYADLERVLGWEPGKLLGEALRSVI